MRSIYTLRVVGEELQPPILQSSSRSLPYSYTLLSTDPLSIPRSLHLHHFRGLRLGYRFFGHCLQISFIYVHNSNPYRLCTVL